MCESSGTLTVRCAVVSKVGVTRPRRGRAGYKSANLYVTKTCEPAIELYNQLHFKKFRPDLPRTLTA